MDYLDEEILKFRNSVKKNKYNSLETGMYIKSELIHFSETRIFDERMSVMLPDSFVDLPEKYAKQKYPSGQRPQVIKTSLDTTVNFTFSLLDAAFEKAYIPNVLNQIKSILQKVNPALIFYDQTIDIEKELGWFDFKSYGLDEQIYNIMYIVPIDGKLLHGIFNCQYRDIMEWKEAARQVIYSVRDCTKNQKGGSYEGRTDHDKPFQIY